LLCMSMATWFAAAVRDAAAVSSGEGAAACCSFRARRSGRSCRSSRRWTAANSGCCGSCHCFRRCCDEYEACADAGAPTSSHAATSRADSRRDNPMLCCRTYAAPPQTKLTVRRCLQRASHAIELACSGFDGRSAAAGRAGRCARSAFGTRLRLQFQRCKRSRAGFVSA
jgi:hypothetical protein